MITFCYEKENDTGLFSKIFIVYYIVHSVQNQVFRIKTHPLLFSTSSHGLSFIGYRQSLSCMSNGIRILMKLLSLKKGAVPSYYSRDT